MFNGTLSSAEDDEIHEMLAVNDWLNNEDLDGQTIAIEDPNQYMSDSRKLLEALEQIKNRNATAVPSDTTVTPGPANTNTSEPATENSEVSLDNPAGVEPSQIARETPSKATPQPATKEDGTIVVSTKDTDARPPGLPEALDRPDMENIDPQTIAMSDVQRMLEDDVKDRKTLSDSSSGRSDMVTTNFSGWLSYQVSQASLGGLFSTAVSHWVNLLLSDHELMALYQEALIKVDPDRLLRQFTRFLRLYGKALTNEALNEAQRQGARFARQSAKRTALDLARILGHSGDVLTDSRRVDTEVSETATLNHWLQAHFSDRKRQENEDEFVRDSIVVGDDGSKSKVKKLKGLGTRDFRILEEVKEFMVSAVAFSDLRESLRAWLKLNASEDLPANVTRNQLKTRSSVKDSKHEALKREGDEGEALITTM